MEFFTENNLQLPIILDPFRVGGEDHKPLFQTTIIANLNNKQIEINEFVMGNKKEAEQTAAVEFLKYLKIRTNPYFSYSNKLYDEYMRDWFLLVGKIKTNQN